MATIQHVLALAKRGVPVFPLQPGTKDGYLNNLSDHGATTEAFDIYNTFNDRDLNFGCWTATRLVVIDIDKDKGGIEAWEDLLKEIGPVPRTLTVRSARDGFHLYFWANGELFGSADLVLGKINVRGVNGYVVGPGSSFRDPATGIVGRYEIVEDCEIQPVPDNLRERLRLRELNTAGPTVVSDLDTPAAIAQARARLEWAPPAIQGQSGDGTTIKTANAVLDYGLTTDTAHALMLELWNPRCLPPWDADELRVKVENAWNYRTSPIGRDSPSEGFEPLPADMLRALTTSSPAPIRSSRKLLKYPSEVSLDAIRERQANALVRDLIHPGEMSLLFGKPTSGKSFVALDMGWAIAQGRDWHGRRTRQAPVLYCCFEGLAGFEKRVLAATKVHGEPGKYFALLNVSVTLNRSLEGKDGADTIVEAYRELHSEAGARVPGLIIIDTKSRATAGDDENSAGDTMLFVEQRVGEIKRATGVAVVVVHHPNKDGELRGSSTLEGSADVLIQALKGDEGEDDKAKKAKKAKKAEPRSLRTTKVKDGEEGPLFSYKLDVVQLGADTEGAPMNSCVLKSLAKGGISEREQRCLDLTQKMMHHAIARGENLSPKPRANKNAAGWLETNQPDGGDFTKADFSAALALAPFLGLRVATYTNKGAQSERYESIPEMLDASPAHRASDASGASPALPGRCVGRQEYAANPVI